MYFNIWWNQHRTINQPHSACTIPNPFAHCLLGNTSSQGESENGRLSRFLPSPPLKWRDLFPSPGLCGCWVRAHPAPWTLGDNETQHLRICDVHNPENQWGLHWTLLFEDKREGGGESWGSVAERFKEEAERREAGRTPSGQRGCGLELGPLAGGPGTVTYYFYYHSLDFKYTLTST